MALFQASLVLSNVVQITTNTGCNELTITDESNYSANTSPSSAAANFTYFRTVTVVHMPTGTTYIMQAYPIITPTNVLFQIPAASSGNNTFTLPLFTGDGAYQVTLQTVPTYDSAQAAYVVNVSQVFNPTDGNIYTCIQAGAGHRPDISPTYWTLAPVIGLNYTDIQTVCITCSANQCLINQIQSAMCTAQQCGSPCENPSFIAALQISMALYSIQIQTSLGQGANTNPEFALISAVCQC